MSVRRHLYPIIIALALASCRRHRRFTNTDSHDASVAAPSDARLMSDPLLTSDVHVTSDAQNVATVNASPVLAPGARDFLDRLARSERFSRGNPSGFQFTRHGESLYFLRATKESAARSLWEFNTLTATERIVTTSEALLGSATETLTAEERARRERMRIIGRGLSSFTVSPDDRYILIPLSGRLFLFERATSTVRELLSKAGTAGDARFSPDGTQLAVSRRGALWVMNVATGTETRVTPADTKNVTWGSAEFVAQEEMDRYEGFWWSPDGSHIAVQRTDESQVEHLRITDAYHPENPPDEPAYPRVGTPNADVQLGIFPVTGGTPTMVLWDRATFPYLATVRWDTHGPLTILVQNREQTYEKLLAIDPRGIATLLLEERDPAWVNISQDFPVWLPDDRGFLWASEASGWWQISRHAPDGKWLEPITAPELGLRRMVRVNDSGKSMHVVAGAEPSESQITRVELGTTNTAVALTQGHADHDAVVSKDGAMQVIVRTTLDSPTTWDVSRADGSRVGSISSVADPPGLPLHVTISNVTPNAFRVAVVRPSNWDITKRYPVILSVYGGPHVNRVTSTGSRYLMAQWMAEQGFVVVIADGRGTPWRGRAWERTISHAFVTVPLDDQVAALQASVDPSMDMQRVGTTGWSFGGYLAALSVMRRPDVFHAAIAGAPPVDWRDYDTHYTERYLGLTTNESYEASSLLTWAPKLERPLLLIHGTADDNVYFLNSLKLADKLTRAGKEFDFLPLPGSTHIVSDGDVNAQVQLRSILWFKRHLGEPVSQ